MTGIRLADWRVALAVVLASAIALGACLFAYSVSSRLVARQNGAGASMMVQILEPAGPEAVARAAAFLRRQQDVRSADPVSRERAARMLAEAGGAPVSADALPQLRLIEVRRGPAPGAEVRIGAALEAAGFEAELFPAVANPAPARRTAVAIAAAGGAIALGSMLVIAALLGLAAHGRPEAALGADFGVERARVLGAFGRRGADFGFRAGLGSVILLLPAVPAALSGLGEDPMFLSADTLARLSQTEIALVLLTPLLAAAAASLGARWGAARRFDAADLLG